MRDREFYKNKLENYAKVKFKVYRYVMYDRASGAIVPWYTEAAGENQHSLFNFLMFAWGQQAGRLIHGVPYFLLWDKGSANTSAAIKELLRQLEVTPLEHEAGNSRAKGGVEGANNIVETQFESRLRFEPVEDVAQLAAGAEIGAEYKAMPDTAIETAASAMDAQAYPGMNADEVKRARARKATPFAGQIDAHSHLKDIEQPTYMPRAGSEIDTPAHVNTAPAALDAVSAMLRIVDALGRNLTPDEHAFLSRRLAAGLPEDQLDALIAQFNQAGTATTRAA